MNTASHDPHRHSGFTLIELIVTISILTVLAGILIPSVNSYIEKGNVSKARADLREVANVFNKYKVDTGIWPTADDATTVKTAKVDLSGYPCFYRNSANRTGWDGPYLNEGVMVDGKMNIASWDSEAASGAGMLDPWGQLYLVYSYKDGTNDTTGALVLISAGKNGKVETKTDDIFDVNATGDDVLQLVTYNVN